MSVRTVAGLDRRAGLDRFERLTHAYGPANDVPALLRGLGSRSPKVRSDALERLAASVCHQGTLYTATAPTVPHLVALTGEPRFPEKVGVLRLLAEIASLGGAGALPVPAVRVARLPPAFRRAIAAVSEGTETYAALLAAREPEVRSHAAFLLASLPDRAAIAAPLLSRALAREKNRGARAALSIALGSVARERAHVAALEQLSTAEDLRVRAASALGLFASGTALSPRGLAALEAAAAKRRLVEPVVPWGEGDLAGLATRALAALPDGAHTRGALLAALASGGAHASYAAVTLVRRLFAPPRRSRSKKASTRPQLTPDALTDAQRRILEVLASRSEITAADDVADALRERALPVSARGLARILSGEGEQERGSTLLGRPALSGAKRASLTRLYVAAAKARAKKQVAILDEIVESTSTVEQLDLALHGIVEVDVEGGVDVSLELAWRAGPSVARELAVVAARLEEEGAPTRELDGFTNEYPACYVVLGVGMAALALSRAAVATPEVDALLQHAHGFRPRVRDALAALPIARRERWVLDPDRDDEVQPSEAFPGAWPYFAAAPTKRVAERALAHAEKWKTKDAWGGSRKEHADPHLAALAASLRAAGLEAEARRCEAAIRR